MTGLAAAGWAVAIAAGAWGLLLRARLEAVARADHELRGPVAALALAAAALARAPATRERGLAIGGQVERLVAALADLAAARRLGVRPPGSAAAPALPLEPAVSAAAAGWNAVAHALGRRLELDWRADGATARVAPGRLAQAVGNLLANALEHGRGDVTLRSRRAGGHVRIEVLDAGTGPRGGGGRASADRGRGLDIAQRAAAEAGGHVTLQCDAAGTVAAVEFPAAS